VKTADEDELSVQPSLLLTSTHSTNLLSSTNSVSYSILCSRTNLYSTYTHTTHSFPQMKGWCHAVTQAFAYFMNICLFLQSYKRLFMPLQHTGFWISHPVHTAVSTHWHLDHRLRTPIRFFSPQGNKHLFCISFLCRYFEQQSSASERVTHELMYISLS